MDDRNKLRAARLGSILDHFADALEVSVLSLSDTIHGAAKVKADGETFNVSFGIQDPARVTDVVAAVYDL